MRLLVLGTYETDRVLQVLSYPIGNGRGPKDNLSSTITLQTSPSGRVEPIFFEDDGLDDSNYGFDYF